MSLNNIASTGIERDVAILRHVKAQRPAAGTIAMGTRFRNEMSGQLLIVTSVGDDVVRYATNVDPSNREAVESVLWFVTPRNAFNACLTAGTLTLANVNIG